MPSTVGPSTPVNQGLTPRWRAHEHDERETSVLGTVLARHAVFQARAAHLATIENLDERTAVARDYARAYVAKAGAGRDAVVTLFLRAADGTIGIAEGTAVWADDNRPSELRRKRIRERFDTLMQGSLRVARRGAHECIECGLSLADPYERIVSHRRRQRRYCAEHEHMATTWEGGVHEHEIKSALEAATGQHRQRLNRRYGTSLD
jgi:hypothetical protein